MRMKMLLAMLLLLGAFASTKNRCRLIADGGTGSPPPPCCQCATCDPCSPCDLVAHAKLPTYLDDGSGYPPPTCYECNNCAGCVRENP